MTVLRRSPGAALRVLRHLATGERAPILLSYAVTFRCTGRCSYCDLPPAGPELSFNEFRPLLEGFRSLGLLRLGLTGGEPLLHPDIGQIIRHCSDLGVVTVMSTNGALVRRRLDELTTLDVASVSLDGGGALDDRLRGPGSFEAAMDATDLLRTRGVGVVLSATLSARNIGHTDEVLRIAEEAGVPTVWQPYFKVGPASDEEDPDRPDPNEFHAAITRLIAVKLRHPQRIASSMPYLRFIRAHYPTYDTAACLAGKLFFSLSPNGRLHPCYPLIGRGEGAHITPENLRRVVKEYPSVACTTPCFCNGHVENRFLLRLHPLSVFDALQGLLRLRRPGRGPG